MDFKQMWHELRADLVNACMATRGFKSSEQYTKVLCAMVDLERHQHGKPDLVVELGRVLTLDDVLQAVNESEGDHED